MIHLTIPIAPVPKARARSTANGHHYTPTKTRAFEDRIALAVRQHYTGPMLDCPLRLRVDFLLQRPKSAPKRNPGRLPAPKKPDLDNLIKAVKDGINASGLWADDARVVEVIARKELTALGEMPSVTIYIERIET